MDPDDLSERDRGPGHRRADFFGGGRRNRLHGVRLGWATGQVTARLIVRRVPERNTHKLAAAQDGLF